MPTQCHKDECMSIVPFIALNRARGIMVQIMFLFSQLYKQTGWQGECACPLSSVHRLFSYNIHNDTHVHTPVSQEVAVNYITVLFCSTKSSREAKANVFSFDFWLRHSQNKNYFLHALSAPLLSQ